MIKLTFNNWELCAYRAEPPAYQFDDGTVAVVVDGDIPSGWTWELLIAYGDNLDIAALVSSDDGLTVALSAQQLAFSGYYTLQIRATQGGLVKHSAPVMVYIGGSLSGDAHWPEIPTAFSQAIARAEAAIADAQDVQEAVSASKAAAAQSAGDAAGSATAAAQSATTAAQSATDAGAYATSAAGSAESAANSATDAAGSASEAAQSAADAVDSATAAVESATAAAGSAASADVSATAAETARVAAENAQEAAEEAQSAAEAATAQKADKVVSAVAGNLAALDGSGNLVDSGRKTTDFGRARDVQILYKLAQGQIYDTETDAQEAYIKTVPSGAVAAEIGSIGGKTVVWNQYMPAVNADNFKRVTNATDVSFESGVCTFTATAKCGFVARAGTDQIIGGHIYFWRSEVKADDGAEITVYNDAGNGNVILIGTGQWETASRIRAVQATVIPSTAYGVFDNRESGWTPISFRKPIRVDLTQMFGAGNEPTTTDDHRIAAIKAYVAEHPEYDTGSLLSAEVTSVESRDADDETLDTLEIPVSLRTFLADKGYGWSAGSVYNELNLEAKKYIQRVGSVDMGTMTWRYSGASESYPYGFFYGAVANRKPGALKLVSAAYINKFGFIYNRVLFGNNIISDIYVIDDTYTDAATFKSAMSGVMLYYELSEPIEYDISSYLPADNMLDTEAGGTLTFVQDGTKLDVPSSVEYLIKLSEVTP